MNTAERQAAYERQNAGRPLTVRQRAQIVRMERRQDAALRRRHQRRASRMGKP